MCRKYSRIKLDFICPDCKSVIKKFPYTVLREDGTFICPFCSDGISYPEKFFMCLINQCGIAYKRQVTKKDYPWIGKYRYDFCLTNLNTFIEINGMQHYKDTTWGSLEDQKSNDINKQILVESMGFKFISIDARYSNCEWIRQHILNSELCKILDLSNIDWDFCQEFASKSYLYRILTEWKLNKSILEISKELNLSETTVIRYLEIASGLDLCDFNKDNYNASKEKYASNSIKVMSLETKIIYHSIGEARRNAKAFLNTKNLNNTNKTSAGQHWITVA